MGWSDKIPETIRELSSPDVLATIASAFLAGSIVIWYFDLPFGAQDAIVKSAFFVGAASFSVAWLVKLAGNYLAEQRARQKDAEQERAEKLKRVSSVTAVLEEVTKDEVLLARAILARYRVIGETFFDDKHFIDLKNPNKRQQANSEL